ncbi:uncharacterized protein [Primulina eburnea]|uniref:uncharacterized protein isoform X3 n=1 Tax=Primulina eburnea TaxID=1245227 RepID=UPI003C6C2980
MKKILLLNFLEYIVFLNRLANLPDKKKLEVLYNRYNVGWSHDKEQLESGNSGIPHTVGQIYGLVMLCQNLNCVIKWFRSA